MIEINTYSEKDTLKLGKEIGSLAWPGMIILLEGDLGTGKTVLTRGLARGLGIEEPITSPTYTLIHQYQGRLPLYHFDIYRLNDAEEMYDLGYEEFFYGQGVTVVEWPERMGYLRPNEYLGISIEKVPDNGVDKRNIRVAPVGRVYEDFAKEWIKYDGISS
ncbi:MAG: tRNA (adenosine(37)-N6)-threonylcarbamoyltransferase complex ATPase subunit type 1 TsaE [Clostridiales bacterium]|jgi:tRNA threonylcarbamoyladenosine biosynthesis protein TsaE|nr:tRNA (adenosine(37)-N6)-threonylcarbamoyltransferase complex ATPase subunit type 1 TsaE [Clostridiales bacterium]